MQHPITINAPKHRKQAGLTLLELSIGLAIVLAIAALAIGIGTTTSATQRAADAQTQILQISAAARQASMRGTYDGVTAAILARTEKVPAAWIGSDGTSLSNPFGGQYVLTPVNINSAGVVSTTCNSATGTTPCNAVAIHATQLPAAACSSLITNASSNFQVITPAAAGGGTPLKNDRAAPPVALTAESVATACEAGNATISFVGIG